MIRLTEAREIATYRWAHPDEDRRFVMGVTQTRAMIGRPPARTPIKPPPLDPDVADLAPTGPALTVYDEEHAVTYIRMLDADAEGADWREVSRIVLHIDPEREPDRARRAFESHLARAKWATAVGYRLLLRGGASRKPSA